MEVALWNLQMIEAAMSGRVDDAPHISKEMLKLADKAYEQDDGGAMGGKNGKEEDDKDLSDADRKRLAHRKKMAEDEKHLDGGEGLDFLNRKTGKLVEVDANGNEIKKGAGGDEGDAVERLKNKLDGLEDDSDEDELQMDRAMLSADQVKMLQQSSMFKGIAGDEGLLLDEMERFQ